jgi:TRAP-type transport system small permease protein
MSALLRTSLRKTGSALTAAEIALGSLMLLTIFVLIVIQAAQRHLPGDSLAWTGEVSRFGLVWLTFSVAGVLITYRGHITLEVVDLFPRPQLVRAVQVFALLCVAGVAAGLAYEAWNLVQSQGILRSPVLGMSMALLYIPVLIGMISTVLRSLIAAADISLNGPVTAIEGADKSDTKEVPAP